MCFKCKNEIGNVAIVKFKGTDPMCYLKYKNYYSEIEVEPSILHRGLSKQMYSI